jgi:hypothetical protein
MIENQKGKLQDKTIGLTGGATAILMEELTRRRQLGYSASKTSLASEAIIAAYGKSLTAQVGQ